jgi:LemA protein
MLSINSLTREKTMNKTLIIIIAAVLIILLLPVGCYFKYNNQFVALEENVNRAWANVETVLQRRFDLIPNLVNTVKGFAAQEKEIFTEVTRLRSQWASAGSTNEKVATANQMQGALGRLMLVAENYPQLKSNQNFLALQDELAGTENRISVERQRYNEAVQFYNTRIRMMPGRFWAGLMGFERKEPFEAAPEAQQVPQVQF